MSGRVGGSEVRALIVDDNPKFRLELRGLFELERIVVVGEAGNGWEAVEMTEKLDPDVVVMDQNMPALTGIDATRRIKSANRERRVIFLAAEEAWRAEALKAGADGYFVKGDGFSELVTAIHNPEVARLLLEQSNGNHSPNLFSTWLLRGAWAVLGLGALGWTFLEAPQWFPLVALAFTLLSLVLYLLGGD